MLCTKCNHVLQGTETFCPHCGACVEHLPETPVASQSTSTYSSLEVPESIKKWNWGAFMFNAIWGIGNYNYLPLLCLIPFFNFIWIVVCGIKGNEWAWKSGKFNNLDDFIATQETWNRAGRICFFITLGLLAFYLIIIFLMVGFFISLGY